MADKKRFSEDFTHWNDAIPTAFRCMVEDPTTGEEYWVTREQFITGVTIGNMGGASAYDIYKGTTSDIPVLSEIDWINSLKGHDGITPTIGSNGNWFIGTEDTGIKAQPENPIPTAQIFNAPMGSILFYVGLLSSLSDSWHLANGEYVEGYGYTEDWRGKVGVGYDDRTFSEPKVATGMVKNYGAIGNTGGKSFVSLTIDQLPKHSFKTVIAGNNNEPPLRNNNDASIVDIRDDRRDGNSDYSLDGKVGTPTLGKTNTVGYDQPHENRMEYVVGAYIQRVKPEVLSGGNGIESIVAGTNVTIDVTDPKKPVINVPVVGSSTETAPYVLSGLDADIKTGVIASHTILEKHQFTAADIYAEVTTMPEVLGIVVDVLKNGVSIFSTKPSIAAGALHSVGTHVLVTSPTVFNVGDIRSISVDQMGVGDGKTGKNLKLSILMHKII